MPKSTVFDVMKSKDIRVFSEIFGQEIEITSYGYYGTALLMFPAMTDDPLIYEKNGTIDAISDYLENGQGRVFVVRSFNEEIWFSNKYSDPKEKCQKFQDYFTFITEELIPFLNNITGGAMPLIACGASIGGFLAANAYFKRPDCFMGLISLSGFFNIGYLISNYFDDNCYFNSPEHFLPNLAEGNFWLSALREKERVFLFSGSGKNEFPQNTIRLSDILKNKNIRHTCEIRGREYGHNFAAWNEMLKDILQKKI